MSEGNFLKLFPEQEGYRVLLVETAPERTAATAELFERALGDFGADATPTAERLAGFHKVENTYLSTFQALGGLGLLLGTIGLATVLLRNLLERRRELALLRAGRLRAPALPGHGAGGKHSAAGGWPCGRRRVCRNRDCARCRRTGRAPPDHGWRRAPAVRGVRDRAPRGGGGDKSRHPRAASRLAEV
jgi:hypothetical protein